MNKFSFYSDIVVITWENKTESVFPFLLLRKLCPCAFCSGESDVLGNKYIGGKQPTNKDISITKYTLVGNYGVRFFFSDNHSDGIYSFSFLMSLDEKTGD